MEEGPLLTIIQVENYSKNYFMELIFPIFKMKNIFRVYKFSFFPNEEQISGLFFLELTGQTSVLYLSILFFTPQMLQTSDFGG